MLREVLRARGAMSSCMYRSKEPYLPSILMTCHLSHNMYMMLCCVHVLCHHDGAVVPLIWKCCFPPLACLKFGSKP